MLKQDFVAEIYKISGETLESQPEKVFEETDVYLVVDPELKIIWIWAGKKSRLFHRYIAASWAGKLKTKKRFYYFKYELIKENYEPREFIPLIEKITGIKIDTEKKGLPNDSTTSHLPNQTKPTQKTKRPSVKNRKGVQRNRSPTSQMRNRGIHPPYKILYSDHKQMLSMLSEVQEMHSHIAYSFKHLEQRISQIVDIMKQLDVVR